MYFRTIIMLAVIFFTQCCPYMYSMDVRDASPSYKCKIWQGESFKDKKSVPTLKYLAAQAAHSMLQKDAQWLSSPEFLDKLEDDPSAVLQHVSSYNQVIKPLLIKKLLKKYESLITAAHITPVKLIVDGVSLGTLLQCNYDGSLLAKVDPQTSVLKIWYVKAGNVICEKNMGHAKATALRFNRQGDQLAVGRMGGDIHILDMHGTQLYALGRHFFTNELCYNDDGSLIASCNNNSVYIWDVTAERFLNCAYTCTFFSARNVSLVSFKDDMVYIDKDINACRCEREADWSEVTIGYFKRKVSDRGYYVWADGLSEVYDIQTDQKLRDINQRPSVVSRSFSDDGNYLSIASQPNSIQIFECPSYDKVVSSVSLLQTLYVLKHLQEKQSFAHQAYNCLRMCFLPRKAQNDLCINIHKSLPAAFKKLVE